MIIHALRRKLCVYLDILTLRITTCRELPGELERILEWFKTYKVPDGKPENTFGFEETPVDRDVARLVISETHDAYKELKEGQRENAQGLSLR